MRPTSISTRYGARTPRTWAADPVTAYADRLAGLGLVDTAWLDAVGAEVRELRERLMKEYA